MRRNPTFMKRLPEEKVLFEFNTLMLTTHRIRFEEEHSGHAQITSIMLDELCSCGVTCISYPILLVLAIGSFIIGALMTGLSREIIVIILGGMAAGIFLIAFFATRYQVISLASAGATINVRTDGMSLQEARQFVDEVDAAKNERYLLVKHPALSRQAF